MKKHLFCPIGVLGHNYNYEVFMFHISLGDTLGLPETSNDIFRLYRDVSSATHPNQLIQLRGFIGGRLHCADRLLLEAE
jgi:hypothetical protein